MRIFSSLLLSSAICLVVSAPAQAQDSDSDLISVGAGYYDINDDKDAADFRLEYRAGSLEIWEIKPFVGLEATSDGAFFGLGGLYLDLELGDHFVITPSFGAGLYADGDGKDLGHVVEFRSQLELGYQFENKSRISTGISHISNASLGDSNPGTEILSVYYHYPVSKILD